MPSAQRLFQAPADDDVFDADIDDTLPPFRPAPQPTGAWKRRWALGIGGWAVVVAAAYATVGVHLNPYLSLTGLLVGFLVGLTGMGGGALMTPILIFFFGFQPTMAIGTDVTYAAVTKIFGSWKHWRQGSVDVPWRSGSPSGAYRLRWPASPPSRTSRITMATSSTASSTAPSALP